MATNFPSAPLPLCQALISTLVPETAGATPEQWAELERTIEQVLATRAPGLRRQLGIFMRLLDAVARIRFGRPLAQLDPPRREAFLEGLARSPLLFIRRGIWGLRTLVMMGWYTQPGVAASLGYRAGAGGWSARS